MVKAVLSLMKEGRRGAHRQSGFQLDRPRGTRGRLITWLARWELPDSRELWRTLSAPTASLQRRRTEAASDTWCHVVDPGRDCRSKWHKARRSNGSGKLRTSWEPSCSSPVMTPTFSPDRRSRPTGPPEVGQLGGWCGGV